MSQRRRRLADEEYARNGNGHTNGNGVATEHTGLLGKSRNKAKSAYHSAYAFLGLNYCNVLLPIVPAALVVGMMGGNSTVIFVLNFLAIVPLASLLSDATEELAEHVGHTLGGLLNATFGNATELIVRHENFSAQGYLLTIA